MGTSADITVEAYTDLASAYQSQPIKTWRETITPERMAIVKSRNGTAFSALTLALVGELLTSPRLQGATVVPDEGDSS